MTVSPAPENHGIVFRRIDLEGAPSIPALCEYVCDTSRGTTIGVDEARVSTIEHVMSALWTLGVDNALIDINAPETPILDGSAKAYAEEILRVGLVEQSADRKYYEVTEKQVYAIPEKGVMLAIYPSDEYTASVHIDFNSKIIGNQYATFTPEDNSSEKIAPNRTFVFLHEIEALAAMGLVKGGDVDNAIVIVEHPVTEEQVAQISALFNVPALKVREDGYLSNLVLRFPNECSRHKLLDLIGDLRLSGGFLKEGYSRNGRTRHQYTSSKENKRKYIILWQLFILWQLYIRTQSSVRMLRSDHTLTLRSTWRSATAARSFLMQQSSTM